ncbi:hypothetical protein KIN20_024092 [Parelaphostrongylus tenuis]|uniref:Uncharacterized protein n=1 Tax=Parelaphostrongylus tenuis TaxID=148309 RepID=A0AAD5MSW5_PARTN|nr:hypothetical protein KIN20_024092 [Parelaphostrongylus tenuis]
MGIMFLRKVTVKCDEFSDTCSGYVAINNNDKAIMMTFRGTVGKQQLLAEFEATVGEKQGTALHICWSVQPHISRKLTSPSLHSRQGGLR